jgi:hypothetical protein
MVSIAVDVSIINNKKRNMGAMRSIVVLMISLQLTSFISKSDLDVEILHVKNIVIILITSI